ncbi:hypothetical protein DB32_000986 [Sandaracinus amylolyticus]|uniref:Uncharacterized protein n=1 Tax=Sandaracinus amylolyticus TaxID=927083 RepID=A0A0F6VZT3_9BACT|nr:hypothetical protein DB32_000986 [Sandaracinus amylolyticus]
MVRRGRLLVDEPTDLPEKSDVTLELVEYQSSSWAAGDAASDELEASRCCAGVLPMRHLARLRRRGR